MSSETALLLLPPARPNRPPDEVTVGEAFQHEIELLELYANSVTRNGRDIEHPVRTCPLLSDFSNATLPREDFSAMLQHDIAQRAQPGQASHADTKGAQKLLKGFSKTDYAQEIIIEQGGKRYSRWEYLTDIFADLSLVERSAESNRRLPAPGKSTELLAIVSGHDIGPVKNKYLWLEPSAITPPAAIERLFDTENGESANPKAALIKAVEKLDSLMHPPENEQSILRNIHDAESFYAPLCEYFGWDGLATALRNWSNIIRLQKSGHGVFITKAEEIIQGLGSRAETLGSIEGLLGKLALGDVVVDQAFRDTTGHGITLGTAEIGVFSSISGSETYTAARAIWRIKSVGSLAIKLLSDHKELMWKSDIEQRAGLADTALIPADLLAMTIVAEDQSLVAKLFAEATMAIAHDDELSFIGAPRRPEAIHIKGSEDFVQSMMGALSLHPENLDEDGNPIISRKDVDIPKKPEDYHVGKQTCMYEGRRYEIQFQTEAGRRDARIGISAHVLYKLLKQLEDYGGKDDDYAKIISDLAHTSVSAMQKIHEYGKVLGSRELLNPYGSRSRSFRKRIADVSPGATALDWQVILRAVKRGQQHT